MSNPTTPNKQTPHELHMSGIDKRFPGVQALQNADLRVRKGEIHGLVGENGAGKSTMIKVLAGIYPLDKGRLMLAGREVDPITPATVHHHGVRFIHQELNLVPHFTVAEAVFMGQELRSRWFGLKKRHMLREAEAFLAMALNAKIAAHRLIRDLSVAEKKLVQIANALIDEQARMVVFDEPTAPLAADEVEQVFKAIRSLNQRGISMIYISHYLGEITEICHRVTVFRNGTNVALLDKVDSGDTDAIIKAMVGREITELYPVKTHTPGKTRLKVENLGDGGKFSKVSFQVASGEILGIAGLVGSGREELTDAIYGLRQITTGRLFLGEQPTLIASPVKAVVNRLVLVPRDRRNDGLVLEMALEDNINLASLSEVALAGIERPRLARQRARQQIQKLDIRPTDPRITVKLLSGGNQQKTVLARWLATRSRVFILDEPTVGVDIGAKVEIYQLIEDLAAAGAAIIFSSSDPAELLGLCDRLIIMVRGELIADRTTDELTMDSLLALTTCSEASPGNNDNLRVDSCTQLPA